MDDTFIVTVFVVFDQLCQTFLGRPKYHPKMVPAEVTLVAVVAARYFNNNLERALVILRQRQYIPASRCLSISRFNRQLHQQADFLNFCLHTPMELATSGEPLSLTACPCRCVGAQERRDAKDRLWVNKD